MTKEVVVALRDFKKGEPLLGVVHREEGYMYFVEKNGSMMRAPFAVKRLSPAEKAIREARHRAYKEAVARRRQEREAARYSEAVRKAQAHDAKRRAKQAKLDSEIARLQSLKART